MLSLVIFNLLLNSTITASLLIIVIFFFKWIFKSRLSTRWHYLIWFVLILRLAVPYIASSPLNLSDIKLPILHFAADTYDQSSSGHTEGQVIQESPNAYSIFGSSMDAGTEESANTGIGTGTDAGVGTITIDYSDLFFVWLLGVLLLCLYTVFYNIHFWSKVKNGKAFTDESVIALLEECKEQVGVSTNVAIIQTTGTSIPAIFGVTRPWLLIPDKVLKNISHENLRYIILHELTHLKRRDIIINWITFSLQIIHWFNPLIWLAFHKMRSDRELLCDENVLTRLKQEEIKKYGHTIIDMAELVSNRTSCSGIAGILEDKSQLKSRISMISRFGGKSRTIPAAGIVIAVLLTGSVFVNADDYAEKMKLPEASVNSFADTEISDAGDSNTDPALHTGNRDNAYEQESDPKPGVTPEKAIEDVKEESLEQLPEQITEQAAEQTPGSQNEMSDQAADPKEGQTTEEAPPANPETAIGSVTGGEQDPKKSQDQTPDTSPVSEEPAESAPEFDEIEADLSDETADPPAETTDTAEEEETEITSKGILITSGITVTTDSSGYHKVYIDKNKLPPGLQPLINMSLACTGDISDESILFMASYQRDAKFINWQYYGDSGEYYRWRDRDSRYFVILLYDRDMTYIGYFIHENPLFQ